MDAELIVLERLAEYFYDPLVFWGTPLLLAVFIGALRRVRAWLRGRR